MIIPSVEKIVAVFPIIIFPSSFNAEDAISSNSLTGIPNIIRDAISFALFSRIARIT